VNATVMEKDTSHQSQSNECADSHSKANETAPQKSWIGDKDMIGTAGSILPPSPGFCLIHVFSDSTVQELPDWGWLNQ